MTQHLQIILTKKKVQNTIFVILLMEKFEFFIQLFFITVIQTLQIIPYYWCDNCNLRHEFSTVYQSMLDDFTAFKFCYMSDNAVYNWSR